MTDNRRLIEDFLPIESISAEAAREKRRGHISTLHLWWARRPLVACRAAVYGGLVPASRFIPETGTDNGPQRLGRDQAASFIEQLCKYPGAPEVIADAQQHILEAHAARLTAELAEASRTGTCPAWVNEFKWPQDKTAVTPADIEQGRAPRPRVLDMFAGGGAIPLEALRLGCEAYALDLNPVAHIIELATLVYPQQYGKPDPNARGMTGEKNAQGETTWGGLAEEVRYWGNWVLEKVRSEIRDLYPLIPDPEFNGRRTATQAEFWKAPKNQAPPGFLVPVAYLWTRTVRCQNPACGATVPLVRQTWLCKKKDRFIALRMMAPKGEKRVRFEVVESRTEKGLGFDPAGFSKGGNATCPFCGTVAGSDYVKAEGRAGQMGQQMMAIVCTRPGRQGKVYLSADDSPESAPDDEAIRRRIAALCQRTGLTVPGEPMPKPGTLGFRVQPYGVKTWGHLFTPRQMLCLLTFAAAVREADGEMANSLDENYKGAVIAVLSLVCSRLTDWNSSLTRWFSQGESNLNTFSRQALPMVWDFTEVNSAGRQAGSFVTLLKAVTNSLPEIAVQDFPAHVSRGSATALPWTDASFDAVITDPPYYDNVPYADISDFFYVWLKRTIGHLYPEHFATETTPKKQEAVADATRHGGSKEKARKAYEEMMARAFCEAQRVLKPGGQMTVVYAHKTTLGWSTLVDALRQAGFTVTEAWPLDTEMKSRLRGLDSAALASSIFLVARKRDGAATGSYEDIVRPDLERIVRERVDALWKMGITGADLVIAAVGAGLRAFTRFSRVEYANGEEVPAGKFLAEVEGVVLETLLEKIFDLPGSGVSAVDGPSRFYILWRYTYGAAEMDAGEAIVFTYGQNVELDGPQGLSTGQTALVEKKAGKYRLRDFTERGANEKLGLPGEANGTANPSLIDVLHRILWLVEHRPRSLGRFLDEARPDREHLRLVAQALAGKTLAGSANDGGEHLVMTTPAEQAALKKLVANWRALIEQPLAAELPLLQPEEK